MTHLTSKFFATSKIPQSADAIAVMEYLTEPTTINRLTIMADLGLPSLSGIVYELEQKFANSHDFPLHHNAPNQNATNRQNIGRMIKFVMREFGYSPVDGGLSDRARLRDFAKSEHFSTAAVYEKTHANPNHKISVSII
ncbi:MAG: hypothetical protein ACRC8J_09080 [Phocaeicola sp.]